MEERMLCAYAESGDNCQLCGNLEQENRDLRSELTRLRALLAETVLVMEEIIIGKEVSQLPGFPAAYVCIPINNKNKLQDLLPKLRQAVGEGK